MDARVLQIEGVRHRYGALTAVDGVDLRVAPGECVALLGPNGAGKTTLIGLATGLLAAQEGRVRVCGGDPRSAATRRHLGVVQQTMGFPTTLTVAELVRGAAVRAGRPAAAAGPVLAEVGITDLARRRSAKLSGGQRQRVALAMALVGDPDLLLLDEPTAGLDVAARRTFWQVLARRRDAGVGILLTTHILEEAASTADRVVVLHRGRVVAEDSPGGLSARLADRTLTARSGVDVVVLRGLPGVLTAVRDGERVRVTSAEPERVLRAWLPLDDALGELRVEGAGLEQALFALTDDRSERDDETMGVPA
ncbi:ABC transporter ATP-binding protein [Pseudonocardia lacus]|uniref:ABC transporter ATP-binding protein n=1 Tax=Pseudonocardia lacus TaxID=2835865 RepID=UPI001BDCAF26|nr:ABC transporter ATP-binding protein [Pseudonocardia lacus]